MARGKGAKADSNGGVGLKITPSGDVLVIVLSGELDFATVGTVTNCIEGALCDHVRVCILDCRALTIADSEAARALLGIQDRFRRSGKELKVLSLAWMCD
ncbi:MAG: STAS domain-containing protein [Armatimonadota bacterium]|nr:STAS domain-containing protein [Armatimonadota bacterium]